MLPKTPLSAGPHPAADTTPHPRLRARLYAVLPRTLAEAESRLPGPVDRWLRSAADSGTGLLPATADADALDGLAERFLADVPLGPALREYGRYELDTERLRRCRHATAAALAWDEEAADRLRTLDTHPARVMTAPLTRPRGVRVRGYDHDVLHHRAPYEIPARAVTVVTGPRRGRPPLAFRAEPGTAGLLLFCDGVRTGAEVAAAAGIAPRRALPRLGELARHGMVLLAGPTEGGRP
ncbi:FUSC family protein [Streptomyces vinaceus]|uniref:hypothetical protein n=1 Tax=Streptomyces vinaceus TaxID=1960 RepID=UPI0036A6A86C